MKVAQPTAISAFFAVWKRRDLCWFIFALGATPSAYYTLKVHEINKQTCNGRRQSTKLEVDKENAISMNGKVWKL